MKYAWPESKEKPQQLAFKQAAGSINRLMLISLDHLKLNHFEISAKFNDNCSFERLHASQIIKEREQTS